MNDNTFWYGYLDAGEKGSPVLRDERITTDNPDTVYLFNLRRGEILEYRRDLVEQKLRELNAKESAAIEELEAGYSEACRNFKPRGNNRPALAERGRGAATAAARKPEEDYDALVEAGTDDDWDDEEEED